MALTPVDNTFHVPPPDPVEEPPKVAITPCGELWPPPYYLEGGFRRVHPYHYTYNTYCKERWRNRTLVEIFTTEFRDRQPEYYRWALERGLVAVNGVVAGPDYVMKNGQVVSHTLHRHEPPVTAQEIGIIHEDDDLLVIDKPAGVPVHSAGRYHHNTIVEILRATRGHQWLPRPCNRLDRLTSGVMFIGKHPKGAEKMATKLQQRSVQKEYVTRVKGNFPDGVVVCDQPIMSVSPKLGLNRVRATGKDAKTKFRKLAYYPPQTVEPGEDGILANETEGYSIVHCLPLTGRTHQIRVHLQFLGHPISNDPIYSNRKVFGPDLGKNEYTADRDEEIISKLSRMGKTELPDTVSYRTHFTAAPSVPPDTDPKLVNEIMTREHEAAVLEYQRRKGERLSGEKCKVCDTDLYSDPGPHEMGIFLHAAAYADNDGDWKYKSKIPDWALPPDGFDGPREMPDWVPVPEEEERIIGHGVVPPGLDDDDVPRGQGGVKIQAPTLVRGVGMVDYSGVKSAKEEQEKEQEPARDAGAAAQA